MAKLTANNKTIECKLVIFDKDGTLIDQHPLLLELAKARRNSIQMNADEKTAELWEKTVGVDLKNGIVDYNGPLGTAPRQEELLVAASVFYLNGCSWSESRQMAQRAYDEADKSMKPPYGSVLFPGVAEALKKLKTSGLELAIASTDTQRRILESLKALRMDLLFGEIVGGDDVVNAKPSPDMILEILKRTGFKPEETVMVGDSLSDMQMGRNAKVKTCIGVLTGISSLQKLESLADIVIRSAAELNVQ